MPIFGAYDISVRKNLEFSLVVCVKLTRVKIVRALSQQPQQSTPLQLMPLLTTSLWTVSSDSRVKNFLEYD